MENTKKIIIVPYDYFDDVYYVAAVIDEGMEFDPADPPDTPWERGQTKVEAVYKLLLFLGVVKFDKKVDDKVFLDVVCPKKDWKWKT